MIEIVKNEELTLSSYIFSYRLTEVKKSLREQIVELLSKYNAERKKLQRLEFVKFSFYGEFRQEWSYSGGEDAVACEIVVRGQEPLEKSFIYLFVENGTVKYVGDTSTGIRRFESYKFDRGEGKHGSKIFNFICESLQAENCIEIYYKEAPLGQEARRRKESELIELFNTIKKGWNSRP